MSCFFKNKILVKDMIEGEIYTLSSGDVWISSGKIFWRNPYTQEVIEIFPHPNRLVTLSIKGVTNENNKTRQIKKINRKQ